MKFKKQNPKKWAGEICVVKCPEYCSYGYQIAKWNGSDWENDMCETITEYVVGWVIITEN
jgi:hypothetical protein